MTAFLSIAPKVAAFAILLRMFLVALATFKPSLDITHWSRHPFCP